MLVKILITEETENYKLTRESQGFKGGSVGDLGCINKLNKI